MLISRLRAQRGATLIEVIVALAILAILVAAGVPSFAEWIQNTKIRTAAESIQNGLQMARGEAVKRNSTIVFQLTDASNVNWRVCKWDFAADDCDAAAELIGAYNSKDGSSAVRVGARPDTATAIGTPLAAGSNIPGRVGFTGFGRMSAIGTDLMRIDVTNPTLAVAAQRRLVIQISAGGQIRMCDPQLVFAENPRGCA